MVQLGQFCTDRAYSVQCTETLSPDMMNNDRKLYGIFTVQNIVDSIIIMFNL